MEMFFRCAFLAIPVAILLLAVLSYPGDKRAERLRTAIQADDIASIRELVTRWPSLLRPRTRGMYAGSALHTAAWEQRIEVVRLLLELGANVNAKDHMGETPLHEAMGEPIHADDVERTSKIVLLLIASGASVHAKSKYGQTPLHGATSSEAVTILLQHGADPNATDDRGKSPLFDGAYDIRQDVIEALTRHGGDINLRDNDGLPPLQHAVHRALPFWDSDSYSTIETMIRLGAKTSLLDSKALDHQIEFWRKKRVDVDPLAIEWIRSQSIH